MQSPIQIVSDKTNLLAFSVQMKIRAAQLLRQNDRGTAGAEASADGTRMEVGSGEGCPLPSQLGSMGERHQLPQQGLGLSPSR